MDNGTRLMKRRAGVLRAQPIVWTSRFGSDRTKLRFPLTTKSSASEIRREEFAKKKEHAPLQTDEELGKVYLLCCYHPGGNTFVYRQTSKQVPQAIVEGLGLKKKIRTHGMCKECQPRVIAEWFADKDAKKKESEPPAQN
ncbi:MAG: hypothetical protein ABII71_04650 [Candidatus Micrarchaeota archaeon]